MVKKNAPDLSALSSPEPGSVCVGDDMTDTDCSLEALRRLESEAQVAAFEKARAKRAANRAAAAPTAPPPEPATSAASFCADVACVAPTAPIAALAPSTRAPCAKLGPFAKPRKAKTDKGRRMVTSCARGPLPQYKRFRRENTSRHVADI